MCNTLTMWHPRKSHHLHHEGVWCRLFWRAFAKPLDAFPTAFNFVKGAFFQHLLVHTNSCESVRRSSSESVRADDSGHECFCSIHRLGAVHHSIHSCYQERLTEQTRMKAGAASGGAGSLASCASRAARACPQRDRPATGTAGAGARAMAAAPETTGGGARSMTAAPVTSGGCSSFFHHATMTDPAAEAATISSLRSSCSFKSGQYLENGRQG